MNYLQCTVLCLIHMHIQLNSLVIFLLSHFFPKKKTGSLKTTKLITGFKVNFVKTLETPYKF